MLMILAACSGTGKSTVARGLLEACPDLRLSVSYTTRGPRPGEIDGVHYHFVTREAFDETIVDDGFAEWAEYAGQRYGTARSTIDASETLGIDLLFDVDVVGAHNLKASYPNAVSCFLLPPRWAEIERRLRGRGTEPEAVIQRRLAAGQRELGEARRFDYLVVNDELARAVDDMGVIYRAARLRTLSQTEMLEALRREAAHH